MLQLSHAHCLSRYTLLASFCIWVLDHYLYLISLINGDPPQRSVPTAGYAVTEKVVNSPRSVPIQYSKMIVYRTVVLQLDGSSWAIATVAYFLLSFRIPRSSLLSI